MKGFLLDVWDYIDVHILPDAGIVLVTLVMLTPLLLPPVLWMLWKIQRLQQDYRTIWHGIVARGFIEAAKCEHMKFENGRWVVSQNARALYAEIEMRLRDNVRRLAKIYGREPTNEELSWAIEQNSELQAWMIEHGCPTLGVNQHGCLAIACVIARESRAKDTDMACKPIE